LIVPNVKLSFYITLPFTINHHTDDCQDIPLLENSNRYLAS